MLTSLFATTDHLDHCWRTWQSVPNVLIDISGYYSETQCEKTKKKQENASDHTTDLMNCLTGLSTVGSWRHFCVVSSDDPQDESLHKSAQIGGLWCNLRYTCGSLKDSLKLKSETVFVFLLVKFWNFFFSSLHVACSTFLNTHTSHVWTSVVSSLCCAFNCCQPV